MCPVASFAPAPAQHQSGRQSRLPGSGMTAGERDAAGWLPSGHTATRAQAVVKAVCVDAVAAGADALHLKTFVDICRRGKRDFAVSPKPAVLGQRAIQTDASLPKGLASPAEG